MGNNRLRRFVAALTFATMTVAMTGCNGNDGTTVLSESSEKQLSCHEFGYQQLCKGNETQYEEIESPIKWDKNYSYVDQRTNASIYGFYGPIDGHDYYVVTENGYVYDMTVSDEKAEVSCRDGVIAPDRVTSIWGVDEQSAYAVWYAE